jgi:hypothetical protein
VDLSALMGFRFLGGRGSVLYSLLRPAVQGREAPPPVREGTPKPFLPLAEERPGVREFPACFEMMGIRSSAW